MRRRRACGLTRSIRATCSAHSKPPSLSPTALGLPLQLREGLRERSYGAFQGYDRDQIAERYPDEFEHWQTRDAGFAPPDGESMRAFYHRVMETVSQSSRRIPAGGLRASRTVACSIACYRFARDLTLEVPRDYALLNTSVNVVDFAAREGRRWCRGRTFRIWIRRATTTRYDGFQNRVVERIDSDSTRSRTPRDDVCLAPRCRYPPPRPLRYAVGQRPANHRCDQLHARSDYRAAHAGQGVEAQHFLRPWRQQIYPGIEHQRPCGPQRRAWRPRIHQNPHHFTRARRSLPVRAASQADKHRSRPASVGYSRAPSISAMRAVSAKY